MDFKELLGIEVVSSSSVAAQCQIALDEKHMNLYQIVHGGVYFTLADTTAGLLTQELGGNFVTMNANINFLKPVVSGVLLAKAKLVSLVGRIAVIEVSLYNNDVFVNSGTYTMYQLEER